MSGPSPVEAVKAGYFICAIPKGEKGPRAAGWNKRENAIHSEAQAREINGSNYGLLHLYSGTCALDFDDYEKAKPFLAEHGIDADALLNADDAVQIVSGRPNRAKLPYRLPADVPWLPTLDVAGGALELRCATRDGKSTVQDVMPPSIHPTTGKPYAFGGKGNWRKLPVLPPALLVLWLKLAAAPKPQANPGEGNIPEGQRSRILTSLGGAMRAKGMTPAAIEAALLKQNEACNPPLPDADVRSIARSVSRYEAGKTEAAGPALIRAEVGDVLHAVPDPVKFVTPFLPRGVVTLMSAHGGAGKSILSLQLAAHVAAGQPFAGLEVVAGPVLVVSLEDSAALVRFRLRRIVESFGLNPAAIAKNILIADGSDGDAALVTEANEFGVRRLVATPAFDELREFAKGRSLIVIDGASDAFDGDENSRKQVRAFIRMLAALARENDAAVLQLAHIDKNAARFGPNGNAYSGSTAWHNSVRCRLALADGEDGAVELVQEKFNLGKKMPPLQFQWVDGGVLLPVGQRSPQVETADDCAAVFKAIAAANTANVDVPTARSGPATTLSALTTLPELPKSLRTKAGRDRFWAALTALVRAGEIEVETFKTAARHTRDRYRARALIPRTPAPGTGATSAPAPDDADSASSTGTGATGATSAEELF